MMTRTLSQLPHGLHRASWVTRRLSKTHSGAALRMIRKSSHYCLYSTCLLHSTACVFVILAFLEYARDSNLSTSHTRAVTDRHVIQRGDYSAELPSTAVQLSQFRTQYEAEANLVLRSSREFVPLLLQ